MVYTNLATLLSCGPGMLLVPRPLEQGIFDAPSACRRRKAVYSGDWYCCSYKFLLQPSILHAAIRRGGAYLLHDYRYPGDPVLVAKREAVLAHYRTTGSA